MVQLEGGLKVSRTSADEDDPDTDSFTAPDLLVRIGLSRHFELRLAADGFVYDDRGGASNRAQGSDLRVATKVQINCQDDLLPEMGVIAGVRFPTGSKEVTSDGVDPAVELLAAWNLKELFAGWELQKETVLTANLDFLVPTLGVDDRRRIFQLGPQVALDRELFGRVSAYVEYFGEIKTGGMSDEHSVGGGFTWLVVDRVLQLDMGASGGVNSSAPEWSITAGFVWRFRAW